LLLMKVLLAFLFLAIQGLAQKSDYDWWKEPQGQPFLCTQNLNPSSSVPSSVHRLRPADINVIGALGDSITAGYGADAKTLLTDTIEYRGFSWSMGIQQPITQMATMSQILNQYKRPKALYGVSIGNGGPDAANAGLNTAVSGAVAADMPTQAQTLVNKMNAQVDMKNDWKLVTIWIGGNDLCKWCSGDNKHSPENYANFLDRALTIFLEQLPRVFVNVVQILDVSQLYDVHNPPCDALHQQTCPCAAGSNATERAYSRELALKYQSATNDMMRQTKWNSRDDFAAVIQPFFVQTSLPLLPNGQPDRSYLAPDCFHFASIGHDGVGTALWNNMVTPVGKKQLKWTPGESIICPTDAQPFLYTTQNS